MPENMHQTDESIGDEYDGIILGSGHNSLILQAYLGSAGLKTLCLERRHKAGGGLETVEDPRHPGFLHNTHSFYHRGVTGMPWYRDLELDQHGANYLEPELNVAMLLENGESLEWWTDFERTYASFAAFSRKDADALRKWQEEFVPIVEKIIIPESQSPPLPPEKRRRILRQSSLGQRLLEISALSPLEFVAREFEHPAIQAGLLFFNGLREVDLRARGFGHHIPALLASPGKAQMSVGGSASLAQALVSAIFSSGGKILLNCEPRRLVVEDERITGVETENGDFFRARHFVASGLNPHQTFLELLDQRWLPAEWRSKVQNFRYNLIAPLFAMNLNLREPPSYRAAEKYPHLNNAFMVILGLEHIRQFDDIVAYHEAGTIPPTVMWGSCPTIFDRTQAPQGFHTAFMWEKLPYGLHGDASNWDTEKGHHGTEILNKWKKYAPNLETAVIDSIVRSPLDTERSLTNMRAGDLLVGAFTNGQVGYNRPFPGAGHYRGHLSGLYLCASSCHPGGNITGLPGYCSAQVILADLGLPPKWGPLPIEDQLTQL